VTKAYSFCLEAKSYFGPSFSAAMVRQILNEYSEWSDIFAAMLKVDVRVM
jgi:hypothetical protein